MMFIGSYYFNNFGHHVILEGGKHYRMPANWIDTDNKCWSEPYHLYTYDVDGEQFSAPLLPWEAARLKNK